MWLGHANAYLQGIDKGNHLRFLFRWPRICKAIRPLCCCENQGGLQAMCSPRWQNTWARSMLALTALVAQGVCRMRWFSSYHPPALSDADCPTWHTAIDQHAAACCKLCLSGQAVGSQETFCCRTLTTLKLDVFMRARSRHETKARFGV